MTPLFLTLAQEPGIGSLALDLVIVLGVGAFIAWLFQEIRLDPIPGYLIAGVLIGPGVLGLLRDQAAIDQISGLAVMLLMFGIGLHMDLESIRRGMVHILGIGIISTLGVSLAAWGALVWGMGGPAAIAAAIAFAMSSTAVFVRLIQTRREATTMHGRVGLGIAIVQDLAAVAGLALLPVIARWAGVNHEESATRGWFDTYPRWVEIIGRGLVGFGGIALLLVIGRYVLPRALREVARTGSTELLLIVSGAIAFGAALATSFLGFSAEMGAFMAGFLLAATPFKYQLSGQLAPIRDALMAVFFTGVGLHVDPGMIASNLPVVVAGVVALMIVKWLFISGSGWALGMTASGALLTGVYLANAGEFTIVVAQQGNQLGVLTDHAMAIITAVVLLSLVISPLLVKPGHLLTGRLSRFPLARVVKGRVLRDPAHPEHAPEAPFPTCRVVLAGFGPVGRALADRLVLHNVDVTIIELNPRTVERQSTLGRVVVYGDATNPDVLISAGVQSADAIVITVPDDGMALRAVEAARRLAPGIFIAARVTYLSGKVQALQLGADHVTVEEIATAVVMERDVIDALSKRDPRAAISEPAPA